jgi:hypothetical protein
MKPSEPNIGAGGAKAPPWLLGATLVFWGWQTGFLAVGAILAVVLESARFVKTRWDLSDEDFHRLWNLCALLTLTAMIFAFATNEGPGGFSGLFHGSAVAAGSKVNFSGERATIALLRWLPMISFPLIATQAFSLGESVPLTAISLVLRWRWWREQKSGRATAAGRRTDISYPYFIICLFSAGIHTNQGDDIFFWGLSALLAWALWPLRSRRYGIVIWVAVLALAIALGYLGQIGLGRLEQMTEDHNAQWLVHFTRPRISSRRRATALRQIGRLKMSGRIVIRLHPKGGGPPPPYLREASYQNFRSGTWYAGWGRSGFEYNSRATNDITWTLPPGKTNPAAVNIAGRGRSGFEYISHETNETTWILLPGKTNPAAVNIACYLGGTFRDSDNPGGLLPLPTGSGQLKDLNAYLLQKNRTGAVLAEGPGLVIFDAEYGPGPTIDSPPDANLDFMVSSNEMPALDQVISEMKLPGRDEKETLQRVQKFFHDQFRYSTWLGPEKLSGTNETPLGRFLLNRRTGHCEYFATATVLLLRRLDIPARYAVGFAVHETYGSGYVVRERDAHAWCLVWNRETRTWEDFDTTPASWIETESRRASSLQRFSDLWSDIGFQISKLRWRQMEWRRDLLWGLFLVLVLLLYQILFRRRWTWQWRKRPVGADILISWPGLDSEFYQLEKRLAGRGVPRRPSEPLSDWLSRALADLAQDDLQTPLRELLHLHYRYRFDPSGLAANEREALKREAKVCLDALAQVKPGAN